MATGATIAGSRETLAFAKCDTGAWLQIVERQVRGLKFGSVQITVHEGRVVQIETSAKIRFDRT
jgi:hypothetical protein